ncbi:A1S_2505 family phage non-structural protein [Paucibacter soli]|uniref:A1S_2505 family phage non-structural protein n=1 Tax=Paucibacter soli TaxID=3133433 RepID=UPI00403527F9
MWVFGSNTAGRHGKGAAEVARLQFGAQRGVGVGRTGRSYGIPTKFEAKDRSLRVLPLGDVMAHIADFLSYGQANPELKFFVTRVGCELARHGDSEIAPLFKGAPSNCNFPEEWRPYLAAQPDLARRPRPR